MSVAVRSDTNSSMPLDTVRPQDLPFSQLATTWVAVEIVQITIPSICLALRIYIRARIIRIWRITDTALIVAWLLFAVGAIAAASGANRWAGIHAWDLDPADLVADHQHLNSGSAVYTISMCLVKVSILLQFAEIFVPNRRSPRWWLVHALVATNVAFFLTWALLTIFQCWPRARIWDESVPGSCVDFRAVLVATATFNMVDDFLMLALPVYWVKRLQMPRRRKNSVYAIFGLGFLACCCSCMRLVESIRRGASKDYTVDYVPIILWAQAELAVGVVVACLPYMPKLFEGSRPATFNASVESGQSQTQRNLTERSKRSDVCISLEERGVVDEEHFTRRTGES